MNETNIGLYLLIGIIGIFFLILLLFGSVQFLSGFSDELKYLNTEINRTRGKERRYWKHRTNRVWLSLLPCIKY